MHYKINTKFASPTQITKNDFIKLALYWKNSKSYAIGTMENKAAALREILTVCGNTQASVDNKELGISTGRDVLNTANVNKGCSRITEESYSSIKDKGVAAALKVIEAYGLRKEEGLSVAWALSKNYTITKDNLLILKGSWCKNGKSREFLMRDGGAALKEAATLLKDFMVKGRIEQFMNRLDRAIKKIKVIQKDKSIHPHALRHNYAQERYFDITGMTAPAAGGLKYSNMPDNQKLSYNEACLTMSQELGHDRDTISRTYIGK
jgi:hypothetical protein